LQAHAFFEAQGFSAVNKKAFVKYRRDMKVRGERQGEKLDAPGSSISSEF